LATPPIKDHSSSERTISSLSKRVERSAPAP